MRTVLLSLGTTGRLQRCRSQDHFRPERLEQLPPGPGLAFFPLLPQLKYRLPPLSFPHPYPGARISWRGEPVPGEAMPYSAGALLLAESSCAGEQQANAAQLCSFNGWSAPWGFCHLACPSHPRLPQSWLCWHTRESRGLVQARDSRRQGGNNCPGTAGVDRLQRGTLCGDGSGLTSASVALQPALVKEETPGRAEVWSCERLCGTGLGWVGLGWEAAAPAAVARAFWSWPCLGPWSWLSPTAPAVPRAEPHSPGGATG